MIWAFRRNLKLAKYRVHNIGFFYGIINIAGSPPPKKFQITKHMNIINLFQLAVEKKASDLHLVVGLSPILRIDGNLVTLNKEKMLTQKDVEQMVFSILNENQKKVFLATRELDFSYSKDSKERFRVNLHYERGNIGLTARVVNKKMPLLKELERSEEHTSELQSH